MSSHLIRPGYQTARLGLPPKKEFYITAYVEGLDDEKFWREVFKQYSPVEVKPSMNKGSADGKEALWKNLSNTGKDIIICVDSDFDYLIPNNSLYSNLINNHRCIFQTYTHSIENFLCYAKSLNELCKKVSINYSPKSEFNFNAFFRKYSQKIYEPFIYYIYFKSMNNKNTFKSKDFERIIKIDSNKLCQAKTIDQLNQLLDEILDDIEMKLIEKIIELIEKIIDLEISNFNDFSNKLKNEKDVRPDETYLFIKGHTLFNSIAMRLLRKIVYLYSKEKMKNIIEKNDGKPQEIKSKLRQYQKNICSSGSELKKFVKYNDFHEHSSLARGLYSRLEDKLKENYNFFDCYLMSKIKEDIDSFIEKYYPNL